ncbi:ABC transporter permease [Bacteroidia bacterium]|nr:ABC transporter permease [Bacteroidia bacterium]
MIKNFLFVLSHFKTSSVLNILGLSAAFAVFSITMIQCYYDFSFDRNFKHSDEIYQFSHFRQGYDRQMLNISIPLAQLIVGQYPEVKAGCVLSRGRHTDFKLQVESDASFSFNMVRTDEGFLEVFTPKILSGNAKTAFTEKNNVLLTDDVAKILFGEADPLGQVIWQDSLPYTVVAVCEQFPENCSLSNGIYTTLLGEYDHDKMTWYNRLGFFRVHPDDISAFQEKLNQPELLEKAYLAHAELIPLTEKYFGKNLPAYEAEGNLTATLSFMAIGIIILVIAFINFMNFSIAMIPSRVRGMNIRKIMGATPKRLQFLTASEAPCFAILSFGIALFLVVLFQRSQLTAFFPADLSPEKNVKLLAVVALTGIAVSILFGLYPARRVTSFQPAMALSGSFSQSKQSVFLRNVLITIQFFAAISLIIIAGFIKIQRDYMTNYSWGFQKENIVYLSVESDDLAKVFENEIGKNPAISGCTVSPSLPGQIGGSMRLDIIEEEKPAWPTTWMVRHDFLDFFGIRVIEGRDYIPDDDGKQRMICNQAFLKEYGYTNIVGTKVLNDRNLEFVGVIQDIHFESLRSSIRPLCFVTWLDTIRQRKYFFIKISGENTLQTLDFIKNTWEKLSGEPADLHFLDETIDGLYQSESNLARLISIFGLIAVIIAVMGVYGLIVFNAKYKQKEIAIRKVNGSTIKEIMLMLNKNVLLQLGIAFAAAVPAAYYIVNKWLENFAYKTPMHWWVFLLGGFIILLITLLTVSVQSYKAARANPTKAINS